ncbi:MAG TPA: pilus assembly protein PilM [Candidatus Ratteibacteria bacterium]|nr:pilus assembly protein PilM [Candidatus Ratteibacteria bacterium]
MLGKGRKFAVDFGTTKIRIADFENRGNKIYCNFYQEIPIPYYSPEERENFLKKEAKGILDKNKIKTVIVSLPGRGLLLRQLNIPKVPPKKLKDILKYEVQQQIPFPLEVVEWKYQILGEEGVNLNILLSAIKKELVNEYIGNITGFGIDPVFLDTDLFAVYNAFRYSPFYNEDKCTAILEIGETSSNFIILYRKMVLMRSLTISGSTITSSIMETEGISYKEAENKKIEMGMQLPACISSIESLNTEIQNSVDYWRFTQKGPEVSELYICGKTSLLNGFKESIQEKSKIKTEYFSPLSTIEINPKYENLRENEVELAVLTGIALRNAGISFINIDMLPEEIKRVREFKLNRLYIYVSIILAGLISITPVLFLNQDKAMLKGILSDIEISLSQYEKYEKDVNKLQNEIKETKEKCETISGLISKKGTWLKNLIYIGRCLPSSKIYLTSFSPGAESQTQQGEQAPISPEGQPVMPPGGPSMPPGGAPMPPGGAPMPPGEPSMSQSPQEQIKPNEVNIETQNVYTLKGEVVITDIKSAFDNFKSFVKNISNLEFIQKVDISYCEVNSERNVIEFTLLLNIK